MSIRGWFVWEELMTTDLASAAGFYKKVAGLTTQKAAFDPNYTMFRGSNGNMGGLMLLPDEAKQGGTPPCWISYIGTPNADETARMAASLGGRVQKAPWDISDGGRIAILSDPQGAVFAIYSNPKTTDAPPAPKLGHASWHELATSDYIGAFTFYQSLFGWHIVNDMDMGPGMGMYRLFAPEGMTEAFGGMYTKPPQQPGPPAWLPYIKVASAEKATATAKKLGAQIMHGPAQVPGGGWITMAADPQGVMFALHETPSGATKPTKKETKGTKKKSKPKKTSAPARKKAKAARKSKARPKAKRKAGSKK
jgi:predicted enzyme related to lactoylglutathione lyase